MTKSPLTYHFARCLRCLSPAYMVECRESCELLFQKILEKLVSFHRISGAVADEAKQQYNQFISVVVRESQDQFMSFDKELDRLDTFLWKFLSPSSSFGSLTNVVKMLLILSHGQAQVERGFSVNSKLLVENLHNTSLISQRIVNDYMVYKQIKPQELVITPSLLNHVKEARSRYFNSQKERAHSNLMDQCVHTHACMHTSPTHTPSPAPHTYTPSPLLQLHQIFTAHMLTCTQPPTNKGTITLLRYLR